MDLSTWVSAARLKITFGLYYTTLNFFKDHLVSYKLLNRSGNKDIDEINNTKECNCNLLQIVTL